MTAALLDRAAMDGLIDIGNGYSPVLRRRRGRRRQTLFFFISK